MSSQSGAFFVSYVLSCSFPGVSLRVSALMGWLGLRFADFVHTVSSCSLVLWLHAKIRWELWPDN